MRFISAALTATVACVADAAPSQLSIGIGGTVGIVDESGIRIWGGGDQGGLGQDSTTSVGDNPSRSITSLSPIVFANSDPVVELAVGSRSACALFTGGIRCWGRANLGGLGYDSTADVGDGVGVAMSDLDYLGFEPSAGMPTKLFSGQTTYCAFFPDGVRCWGSGERGVLGTGDTANVGDGVGVAMSMQPAIGFQGMPTHMSLGTAHACVILDGDMICYGMNNHGQCGVDSTQDVVSSGGAAVMSTLPPVAFSNTQAVVDVSIGHHFSCALFSDGRVKCFGSGQNGQHGLDKTDSVGNGAGTPIQSLPFVDFQNSDAATEIESGSYTTCALFAAGVRCWGRGDLGSVGHGASTSPGSGTPLMMNHPVIDFSNSDAAIDVQTGGTVSCVLFPTGVKCFGFGSLGGLGYDNTATVGAGAGVAMNALPYVDLDGSCGNGVVVSSEECDDEGTVAGDGCSATCTVESGYKCLGTPSVCTPTCGNGIVEIDAHEQCDDGGTEADDGCSSSCLIEDDMHCTGEPSQCDEYCNVARRVDGPVSLASLQLDSGVQLNRLGSVDTDPCDVAGKLLYDGASQSLYLCLSSVWTELASEAL